MELKYTASYAMKNRKDVEAAGKAGCFSCLGLFQSVEVKEYTDKGETVLCPLCGVDTVVADTPDCPLNRELLEKAKNYWF